MRSRSGSLPPAGSQGVAGPGDCFAGRKRPGRGKLTESAPNSPDLVLGRRRDGTELTPIAGAKAALETEQETQRKTSRMSATSPDPRRSRSCRRCWKKTSPPMCLPNTSCSGRLGQAANIGWVEFRTDSSRKADHGVEGQRHVVRCVTDAAGVHPHWRGAASRGRESWRRPRPDGCRGGGPWRSAPPEAPARAVPCEVPPSRAASSPELGGWEDMRSKNLGSRRAGASGRRAAWDIRCRANCR